MIDKKTPMALGDIFNNAFVLIKDTLVRNLIIAAVFIIPAGIISSFCWQSFFSDFGFKQVGNRLDVVSDFELFLVIVGTILFVLCHLACHIGIFKIAYAEVNGERINLKTAFSEIFSETFMRYVGLILLFLIAYIAYLILFVVLLTLGNLISPVIAGLMVLFLFIATIFLLGYAILHFYFAGINIISEHEYIMKSLSKSHFLIKDNVWRTFGIMLLILTIIGFASTLISTPITFIIEWDSISQYLKIMASGDEAMKNPAVFSQVFKSIGFTTMLVLTFSTFLQTITYPLFAVVMYMDLKIRKNDFPIEIIEESNIVEGEAPVE